MQALRLPGTGGHLFGPVVLCTRGRATARPEGARPGCLTRTRPRSRRSGHTVLDLMVGMFCACILVVTMGVLLYLNYTGWAQLQDVAEMQRDGSLAMNTLTEVLRGGNATNLIWNGSNSYLVVNTTDSVEGWRFTQTNGRLVYARSGVSNMDLVRKGLTSFTCVLTTTDVVVRLNLTESSLNASMNLTNTIHPRN